MELASSPSVAPTTGRALHWLALALLALVVSWTAIGPLQSNDIWWHLRLGEIILEEGAVPETDRFSFTAEGTTDPNYEWLSQVTFALVHRAAGLSGLIALRGALLTATMLILFLALRRRGASPAVAMAATGLAWIGVIHRAFVQPQIFSYLLIAVTALIGARWMTGQRGARWWLIPLGALWGNLHWGRAPLGLVIAGAFALEELLRASPAARQSRALSSALLLGLMGATLFLNPLGTDMIPLLTAASEMDANVLDNHDWRPFYWGLLSFEKPGSFEALLVAMGLGGLGLALRRRQGRALTSDALLFVGFAVLALRMNRTIPSFMLLSAGGVALGLQRLVDLASPHVGRLRGGRGAALALLGLAALLPALASRAQFLEPRLTVAWRKFPDDAARWLQRHAPSGRVLNYYDDGGFLIWSVPKLSVFIDGRDWLYRRRGVDQEHVAVWSKPRALQRITRRYGITMILAPNRGLSAPFGEATTHEGLLDPRQWALAFHGPNASLYLRRGATHQELIERWEYRYLLPGRVLAYVDRLASPRRHLTALLTETERPLAESPTFAEAWLLKGRALQVHAGDARGAARAYLRALELEPWTRVGYHVLAEVAHALPAEADIERVIDDLARYHGEEERETLEGRLRGSARRAAPPKGRAMPPAPR
jgi:hypothetical protein